MEFKNWLIVGTVATFVVAIIAYRAVREIKRQMASRRWMADLIDIAYLEERSSATAGGQVAMVLLAVFNIGIVFLMFGGMSRNILQETVLALIWIGGNLILCLGVAIGRRRDYVVRRPRIVTPEK